MPALCFAAFLGGCAVSPPDDLGVIDGHLAECPSAPHCVCSEYPGERFVQPLAIAGDAGQAWQRAVAAVGAIGGTVVEQRDDYLHATFTTRLLRFVDDLELRLDSGAGVIHVRSASRIGYYDFNVNRNRVERLRQTVGGG